MRRSGAWQAPRGLTTRPTCATVAFVTPTGLPSHRGLAEFLLRACHDLRSPVRTIRAYSELMATRTGPGDGEQHLAFIMDAARIIELLAEGLADYASALQIEPNSFQPVPMDVMLRTATARLDKEIRDRGASVTYGELPMVSGDAGLLAEVLEELLRNGLRHSGRSAPHIDVSARKEEADWVFTIQDDGCGIEEPYLERIFRPCERLGGSNGGGAGLGLTICRVIVEGHGGRIRAESTPGAGATFRFTLPAATP